MSTELIGYYMGYLQKQATQAVWYKGTKAERNWKAQEGKFLAKEQPKHNDKDEFAPLPPVTVNKPQTMETPPAKDPMKPTSAKSAKEDTE